MTLALPVTTERASTPRPAKQSDKESVTLDRLERGLALVAYLMELDGTVLAPIFEKLEREVEAMRARQDTTARARRLLDSYRIAGGLKAMR